LLLRDFAAVEQNFRTIARSVQEQQLRPDARKGAVVGYVLDADAELRASDQGRSFYAFWEFLTVPTKQDELHTLLDQVYNLPTLGELGSNHVLLRRLSRALLEAGEKIVQSNHRLAEQVRRLVDDRTLAESRRVRELIDQIKRRAASLATTPPAGPLLWLDGPPNVHLLMEKALWEPGGATVFAARPEEHGDTANDTSIGALYRQFYVDESRLQRQIEFMLEIQPTCTLAELLHTYPPEKGLSEIIAYLAIASRDGRHTIDSDSTEPVTLPTTSDFGERHIAIPHVVFRSAYAS
jgi:hypothetical protein